MEDTGKKIQRTFYVRGEKIVIKSHFSHRKMGFIVHIDGKKYFNNGSTNGKWTVGGNLSDWRSIAEDRCYKKWLDEKFEKK